MEDLALRQADAEAGTEVVGVAKRRVFSAEYKRRTLEKVCELLSYEVSEGETHDETAIPSAPERGHGLR